VVRSHDEYDGIEYAALSVNFRNMLSLSAFRAIVFVEAHIAGDAASDESTGP
jgi:hypothetical protein